MKILNAAVAAAALTLAACGGAEREAEEGLVEREGGEEAGVVGEGEGVMTEEREGGVLAPEGEEAAAREGEGALGVEGEGAEE